MSGGSEISNDSITTEISNGSITTEISNGSITTEISNGSITTEPSNGSITTEPSNGSVTTEASDKETSKSTDSKGGGWKKKLALLALCATPLALATYYLADHPYKAELARRTVNLSGYSREQRLNFITAARSLDGAIIEPGQTFSFNAKVGPRTGRRGFVPAGSYLGGSRVNSEGGGICLISSNLYQAALLSGLKIKERAAHTTCVRSVPPGLDATVWYGKVDLKLVNPYKQPVQIRCESGDQAAPNELVISIAGPEQLKAQAEVHQLRRRELAFDGRNLLVEVYLDGNGHIGGTNESTKESALISRDRYRLP